MRSRFGGPYIKLPAPTDTQMNEASAAVVGHAPTPFFATQTDDGAVRQLYFFANETLADRNFKRGIVGSFLSVSLRPVRRLHARNNVEVSTTMVDQDENGVYVRASCERPQPRAPLLSSLPLPV